MIAILNTITLIYLFYMINDDELIRDLRQFESNFKDTDIWFRFFHDDGGAFYDINCFNNKKKLNSKIKELELLGYKLQ